jgi:hypothetical protein
MSMALIENLRTTAYPAAKHEAGHYIVAMVLGFRADEIHVNVDSNGADGGSGLYLDSPFKTIEEISEYCDHRAQVLCAGAISQFMKGGQVDEPAVFDALKTGTALNDWAKLRENVRILCGIRYPAGEQQEQQLEAEAVRLLNASEEIAIAESAIIEALARQLIGAITRPGKTILDRAAVRNIPEIAARFGTS